MNAAVLCVGRLKEKWQKDGCAEYLKRLSRYGRVEVIEVDDQPEPAHPSEILNKKVMDAEGQALLKRIRPNDFVIALCIRAQAPDSEGLSRLIEGWSMQGRRLVFVIGGSLGLSEAVIARADQKLSFSNLTFPHPLMRVVLLEQLYRAERIRTGERYHK